jgi:hypothetical protein
VIHMISELLTLLALMVIALGVWALVPSEKPEPSVGPVPRKDHELLVASLQAQLLDTRKDRDELMRRLLEVCDPGVNARLAPAIPRPPKPVVTEYNVDDDGPPI